MLKLSSKQAKGKIRITLSPRSGRGLIVPTSQIDKLERVKRCD